jgi:peroxiredoxin
MAATAITGNLGSQAPDFHLPGTDGKLYALEDIRGPRGTLVMFICNHCPYVRSAMDRIVRDAAELASYGVGTVAISSNDAVTYPDDSFANMKVFAAQNHVPFPYLYDETQEVARAFGAVCTPDFFGFNAKLELQYRGRLDEGGRNPVPGARRDLFEAMKLIAEAGQGPRDQTPSIGCSIKWKPE